MKRSLFVLSAIAIPFALVACSQSDASEPAGNDDAGAHSDGSIAGDTGAADGARDGATGEAGDDDSSATDGGSIDAPVDTDGGDAASKGDPFNFAPPSRTVAPIAVYSSSGSVTSPTNLLTGKTTTLSGSGAQIVLDFGKEVGGVLSIAFANSSGGQTVGVAFSESSLYVGPNSDNSNGGGNSDGALSVSVSGAMTWTSDAKYLRGGFRYVTIFLGTAGTVDITGVSLAFSPDPERAIPNQYANYFYSNDPVVTKAWYAGAYTVQTNIIGVHQGRPPPAPPSNWDTTATVGETGNTVIVDGAKRDRTVWPGDMGISLNTGYTSLGDTTAAKNALVTLFNHQHADGHLNWSGPPWNLDNGSDTYHMWTMYGVYLAYLYTGDKAWLDTLWTKYQSALTYIRNKIDGNGLLNVTSLADWGPRVPGGGENIEANAILYGLLNGSVVLANAEGDTGLASTLASVATTLKAAANSILWDSSVGAYRESPGNTLHPQDGNSVAVWFGLADDPTKAKSLSFVHAESWNAIGSLTPEWGQISTYVGSMELMSHFVAGYDTRGLDMIRKEWGYMLAHPKGPQSTFWESYTSDGTFASNGSGPAPSDSFTSLAHGWGTGPTAALTFYVLGIAPETVVGKTYHVIPHPGDLTHVEGKLTFAPGKVVSAAYDVGAACHTFAMTVDASSNAGSTGTLAVPRFGADHSVTIGGAVAWNGASFVASSGIAGAHQDDAYVYFTGVQPGTYALAYTDGTSCGPAVENWSFCANEAGNCTFTGKKRVRFGRNGGFKYTIADGAAGPVACTSATFLGDPSPNNVKLCQTSDDLFVHCANEAETCTFPGTKEVRFGANGQWKSMSFTGSALCDATTFGVDPLPNVVKTCEYR